MGAGRPFGTLKYDTLEALEAGIDKYFSECDEKGKPYSMFGLALALNIDVKTLSNYSKIDNYFPVINRARHKCLEYNFERMYDKNGVQGAKFVIINDAERMVGVKYSEKQDYSVSVDSQIDADALKGQLKDLMSGLSPEEKAAINGE